MSRSVLSDLETFDKKKPKVYCPHPLYDNFGDTISKEEAKIQLGLDPEIKYILFFGFIRAYKGLDLLIRSIDDERLRNMPLKAIIAGEYYEDDKSPVCNKCMRIYFKAMSEQTYDIIKLRELTERVLFKYLLKKYNLTKQSVVDECKQYIIDN